LLQLVEHHLLWILRSRRLCLQLIEQLLDSQLLNPPQPVACNAGCALSSNI